MSNDIPRSRARIESIERRLTRIFSLDIRDYFKKWIPLGIMMGLVGGLGAMAFEFLLELIWSSFYETVAVPWYLIVLIPAAGGVIMGFLVSHMAPEAEGPGQDNVINALHHTGGKVRPIVAPVKLVASALTIGTGGSAGREGPISQITAGLANFVADRFKLSRSDLRILVISGMAAGMSAVFKAPLGAAIFAIEIPYKNDLESSAIVPAMVSSAVAYLVFVPFYGVEPLFSFPDVNIFLTAEVFPLTILTGFVLGLVGLGFIQLRNRMSRFFKELTLPLYFRAGLGGLMVGIIGLSIPGVLGLSEGIIQDLIDGAITSILVLLAILVGKIVATSLTVGSGGSGGVFFPSLVIGGTVGGAIGVLSGLDITPILVVVGMGSMMAGVTKTPIASSIMLTEMVGGVSVLIPLMISSIISYTVTGSRTIYESQITQHSFTLDISMLSKVRVGDVMEGNVIIIQEDDNLAEIIAKVRDNPHYLYPVIDSNGKMVGMAPMDLIEKEFSSSPESSLRKVIQTHYDSIPSDKEALEAFDIMSSKQISRMIVVSPWDNKKIVGIITRRDLMDTLERLDERHHEF
jgi:CIC family chloride channel protein